MRDDIDSWSRPRLAQRLKVVGLRAHVAGDARPQLTRRGLVVVTMMATSITVERSVPALPGLARVSGVGMGAARQKSLPKNSSFRCWAHKHNHL